MSITFFCSVYKSNKIKLLPKPTRNFDRIGLILISQEIAIVDIICAMVSAPRLQRSFFARPAVTLARELLGTRLVCIEKGRRLSGLIIETEAYSGEDDLGCHARVGRTARTEVMYGPPGHAYVYFTYGMHWCLNFVVESEGFPAAVLIRAIDPVEGLDVIASRRDGVARDHWTDGPAKLTKALNIDKTLNGADLCCPTTDLFVESGIQIPDASIVTGPRVGLFNVPEPWKSIPWRFRVATGWLIATKELMLG
ncbi:MAG: putative 3-methyladenine glycosylase [Chloroflexi bacterium]|nr:putative 3-methyladenine glycosylase [Chloroflexota bacterium]